MTQTIVGAKESWISTIFPPPPSPSRAVASSSTPRTALRIHGPSLRRTQLWPSLLLPLSRHRQARDPRPRRRRNIRLFTIHERRGLGTGEITGKHRHRNKRWGVRCRYLLRQEIWGFDHSLEQQQGTQEIRLRRFLDLPYSPQSVLAGSGRVAVALLSLPHRAVIKSTRQKPI